jgi:outer membrane protein OmpA-like peptidoglycan-associated protein
MCRTAVRPSAVSLVIALACLATGRAEAQAVTYKPFEVERLWLEPSGGSSLVASTGDGLEPGGYRLSLVGHYQDRPLIIRQSGGAVIGALVSRRVTTHLLAAWSLASWLDLGVQVPIVAYQAGDTIPGLDFPDVTRTGLGTPLVSGRLILLGQDYEAPLDLSLQVAVALPLGGEKAYATDGRAAAHPSLGIGRAFGGWRIGAELGMRLRPARGLGTERIGHEAVGALALTTTGRSLRGELTYRLAVPVVGSARTGADLLGGVRWLARGWEFFGLAGPGFGEAVGTPRFRVLLGLARAPRSEPVSSAGPAPASTPGRPASTPVPTPLPPEAAAPEATPGQPTALVRGEPEITVEGLDFSVPPSTSARIPPAPTPSLVKIVGDHLELPEQVVFESGRALIQESSYRLLDQVAALLLAHPEMVRVIVEGHTDSKGDARDNLELSQRRAEMVTNYLVVKGLSFTRLEAKGFGASQPIASNATPAGREKNRRIEFRLASGTAEPPKE